MATPIILIQDAVQTTTSGTNVVVAGPSANLQSGVDYLVLYSGTMGQDTAGVVTRLQLFVGDERVCDGRGVTVGGETDFTRANNSGQVCGFTVVRGVEHNAGPLEWRMRSEPGGGEVARCAALCAIAIPLSTLAEDSDFFYDGLNDSTIQLTDAAIGWSDTIVESTFNLPETGDYLVMMCTEGRANTSSTGRAVRVKYLVDGTEIDGTDAGSGEGFQLEAKGGSFSGWGYARVLNLGAGNHTFKVAGGSRNGTTSDYRRGRIVVVRASKFNALRETLATTQGQTGSGTYGTNGLPTDSVTPTSGGFYVLIGCASTMVNTALGSGVYRLRDTTNSVSAREDTGEPAEDAGGAYGTNRDLIPTSMVHAAAEAGTIAWEMQHHEEGSAGTTRHSVEADATDGQSVLIFWDLTEVINLVAVEPIVVAPVLPQPSILPQTLRPDPIVQSSVVVVPGQVPASLTISLVTNSVGGAGPNRVEALLEDRGHVVTQRNAATVTAGDLANDNAVVCMAVLEASVANVVSVLGTAAKPFLVGFSLQSPTFANERTTENLANALGLVANLEATADVIGATAGSVLLASGSQDLAPTRGYPIGAQPQLFLVDELYQRAPTAITACAGRVVLTDAAGRPIMCVVDQGEDLILNVGGTAAVRAAWLGWANGFLQAYGKDGGAILGTAAEWAAGLYENLPFPRL